MPRHAPELQRHGPLNLFAALEGGTGQVRTKFTESKKREDFRAFLDEVREGAFEILCDRHG